MRHEVPALAFAHAARIIGARLREEGLRVPAFRSPPRTDAVRTVRRHPGGAVVAVRIRDREPAEWVLDMVEGAMVAADRPPGDPFLLVEEVCHVLDVDPPAPRAEHEEVPY